MNVGSELVETVEAVLDGDRGARIARDAARIEELAHTGFTGPLHEVFEIELYLEGPADPARHAPLAQLALKQCRNAGRPFFVHDDDMRLLRSSSRERDTILVDVLADAMRKIGRDLRGGEGWTPDHKGKRGACCLMTYFIGQCAWGSGAPT